jgi:two-component system, NtrC family, sensor kinase
MMTSNGKFSSTEHRYLRLFQDITRQVTSALKVEAVLNLIVQKIPAVLGVDAATVRMLNYDQNRLELLAAHGLSAHYLKRGPIDAEKSVVRALAGSPVVVYDAAANPEVFYNEATRREKIKNILLAPIPIKGRVEGILRLLTKSERRFSEVEIAFAAALAEQCGIAIENARAYEIQQRQLHYFKILNDIGKALNARLDIAAVLDVIVTRLPVAMDLKGCTIRLVDPLKGYLTLMAATGLSQKYLERGSIDDELGTHRALKGEPVVIYDAVSDARVKYHRQTAKEGVASILAVPIVVKKHTRGVLRLLTATPRRFSDTEIQFAMAVAEQGGIALANARSFAKINKLILELEQNEAFLQNIMDSLNAQLFVLDTKLRLVMANATFCRNRNLIETDIIGHKIEEIDPALGQSNLDYSGLLLKPKTISVTIDSAQNRYLELTGTSVAESDDTDSVTFVICAVRDVTAQINVQKERQTRAKMEGVVEMAGAVAHELNSPIFVALGTAKMASENLNDPEILAGDLAIITRNLKTIAALTQKMTRLTGYEAKSYTGERNIVDLARAPTSGPDAAD